MPIRKDVKANGSRNGCAKAIAEKVLFGPADRLFAMISKKVGYQAYNLVRHQLFVPLAIPPFPGPTVRSKVIIEKFD